MLIESRGLNGKDYALIERAFGKILDYLKQPFNMQIEVEFVELDEMREINAAQRGINKPTDVLSFPMLNLKPFEDAAAKATDADYDSTGQNIALGSILICPDKVKAQAAEYGNSVADELKLMFTHSVLHLFGFGHNTDADEKVMKKAEREILGLP